MHKLTVAQIKSFLQGKDVMNVHGKKKNDLVEMVYNFYGKI